MQNEDVVRVHAYPQAQAAEMMAMRAHGWESNFLDDVPITLIVHSKHDEEDMGDKTYDLTIDAIVDFDANTKLPDAAGIDRSHDGRHPAIAR